ncbi:MAG: hypothetical protein ACE5J3_01195 [Methanosarcinales archaeon]
MASELTEEKIRKKQEEIRKSLTKEQKEMVDKVWGFIKRHFPEATPEDFKRKKAEEKW